MTINEIIDDETNHQTTPQYVEEPMTDVEKQQVIARHFNTDEDYMGEVF